MNKFILELGFEELPAQHCQTLLDLVKTHFEKACTFHSIEAHDPYFYLTPRRLVITALFSEKQPDRWETLLGPPVDIAMNEDGSLKPAGVGFLKKFSATFADCQRVKDKKGREVLCITKKIEGAAIDLVLQRLFTGFFESLPLPVSMAWGEGEFTFLRPIRWVFSMLEGRVLPLKIMGVSASNYSYGHRFLSQKDAPDFMGLSIEVLHVNDYFNMLKNEGCVILDQEERRSLILAYLNALQQDVDDSWLNEVVFLLEHPTFLKEKIHDKYAALPSKVIETCLRKHQKYFPLRSRNGKLSGEYVIVADNVTNENKAIISQGNNRVLNARLHDALFYFENDSQKGLAYFSQQLQHLRYQEGFGSMADKQERMLNLACYLNQQYFDCDNEDLEKISSYLKADLLTLMVQEFPNLQGYMGRLYLEKRNFKEAFSVAIEEHYWPLTANASLPKSHLGALFSLSDKLDHICAAFYTGQIPSGSRDPMGVRRAVAAVIKIVLDFKINFSFHESIMKHLELISTCGFSTELDEATLVIKIKEFILQRFKSEFEAHGYEADLFGSQLNLSYTNCLDAFENAYVLQNFKQQHPNDYALFVETAKRVVKLSQSLHEPPVKFDINQNLFQSESEKAAYQALLDLTKIKILSVADYIPFCQTLSRFFEDVMVMVDDKILQKNRLYFLKSCSTLFLRFGDVTQLQ